MIVSTKGRYALRVMTDLAQQHNDEFIPLKDIVTRQGMLSKAGLIEATRGKTGGYRLNRAPKDYMVGEILRATEGTLAPVACLEDDAVPCTHSKVCTTLPLWTELNQIVTSFLDSISLEDLTHKRIKSKAATSK